MAVHQRERVALVLSMRQGDERSIRQTASLHSKLKEHQGEEDMISIRRRKRRPGPEQIREIVNNWRDEVRHAREQRIKSTQLTATHSPETTTPSKKPTAKKKTPSDKPKSTEELVEAAVKRLLRRPKDG